MSTRIASAVAALFLAGGPAAAASTLQVFPFPEAIRYTHHNDDYMVRVRTPGGVWQDLYEYKVKVDLDHPSDASMVYFNFDGPVEVAVQKNNGRFSEVKIRPTGKGIKPVVRGRTAYFTLARPENLSKDEFFAKCATVNKWVFETRLAA